MLTYGDFYYQAQFEAERERRPFSRWNVWLDSKGNRLPSDEVIPPEHVERLRQPIGR